MKIINHNNIRSMFMEAKVVKLQKIIFWFYSLSSQYFDHIGSYIEYLNSGNTMLPILT